MSEPQDILAAAAEVQTFCQARAWRFCFIGGIAVQRWGTPRFTQDVDMTLLTGFGGEEAFVDTLLSHFSARLRNAREFALQHRVLLARTASNIDLDIALGAFPFEEESIARATPWHVTPAISLTTCSAEDLVVHKAFANRDRDWSDIESVLTRQHGRLDLEQIRSDLAPLLEIKEDAAPAQKLETMIAAVNHRLAT